jgi:Tol biopolymer transport system component
MLDLARGVSTRLTFSNSLGAMWSPDGKQIYYRNETGIYRKAADGSGDEELVRKGIGQSTLQTISPDGKHLLIGETDILILPLAGEPKTEPYLQSTYQESDAAFSPDGRWIAYRSNESGKGEIYIQGFPDRRGKWQVSSAGAFRPYWRADGKELFWSATADQTLMAATVDLQAAGVRVGPAVPLFRMSSAYFQPARDGKRFLVQEPEGGQTPDRPMAVVLNWAASR